MNSRELGRGKIVCLNLQPPIATHMGTSHRHSAKTPSIVSNYILFCRLATCTQHRETTGGETVVNKMLCFEYATPPPHRIKKTHVVCKRTHIFRYHHRHNRNRKKSWQNKLRAGGSKRKGQHNKLYKTSTARTYSGGRGSNEALTKFPRTHSHPTDSPMRPRTYPPSRSSTHLQATHTYAHVHTDKEIRLVR